MGCLGQAVLLEITNVLVSQLDIRELLAAISASLRRVRPHDYANLTLHDSETWQLRVLITNANYADCSSLFILQRWQPAAGHISAWTMSA